jgi:hypothetical protein
VVVAGWKPGNEGVQRVPDGAGLPPLPCWSGPVTPGVYRGNGPPLPPRWRSGAGSGVWLSPDAGQAHPVHTLCARMHPRVHVAAPRPAAVSCAPWTTPPDGQPHSVRAGWGVRSSPHIRHRSLSQVQSRHHFPVNPLLHPAPRERLTTRKEVIFCHHGHNHPTSR